jgi:hypothetical protein
MVLGIAATAIPFARTPAEEAERWLRVLRAHGDVGIALQSIGVSEQVLATVTATATAGGNADADGSGNGHAPASDAPAQPRDVIALVSDSAAQIAAERGASSVATTDVLMAVLHVYGPVFERALRAHGTDADEVLERLAAA